MRRSVAAVVTESETLNFIPPSVPDGMSTAEMVKLAIDACDDSKGKDITLLDVSENFGLSDYFMVASGRSDRHVQGIANRIIDSLYQAGIEPFSVEGLEEGQWIVIDCVELVIHLFYEPNRSKYDLESLWLNTKRVDLRRFKRAH